MTKKDKDILRILANRLAEIAALPIQEEKRRLWRGLNGLRPERPMVMADQVCWNEMNVNDELTLLCEDGHAQNWEWQMRSKLYQWNHFRVDSVVEPFARVNKAINNTGFGMGTHENTLATDDTNDVISHSYINQLNSMEDVDRVQMPVVTHDEAETARRLAAAQEIFDGIMPVYLDSPMPYLSVWDPISTWMGVEGACYALADKPEMMMALVNKMVAGYMSTLDQLEALDALDGPQALVHCTGAWSDELPQQRKTPWTTRDVWMFGLAQMFSTVSPAMFDEFEIEPNLPIFKRFGLVYYGCCDPLDRKMDEVRKIPNLRKVSISPWASSERGASEIGKDFVFSAKPNPAYLAQYDEDVIRKDLQDTVDICKKYGCPLELILKDISTVKYKPERLWRWAKIAMEVVEG